MDPPRRLSLDLINQIETLPRDLIIEILVRCSLGVMKILSSICRRNGSSSILSVLEDPSFIGKYHRLRRNRHESFLFASEAVRGWKFTSSIVLDPKSTSFLCSTPYPMRQMEYADGLICSGSGKFSTVINLATGKSTALPGFPVESCVVDVKTFLGFDPLDSTFKVFGMSESKRYGVDIWENHQILTLSAKKNHAWKWRQLTCTIPHSFPRSHKLKSVCIEGTVYYTGRLPSKDLSLIQFSLGTETFSSNQIPEKSVLGFFNSAYSLLDLKGKIGVSFIQPNEDYKIWVLEDRKNNKWSSMVISIPPAILKQLKPFPVVSFEGITRTGLSVFSQREGGSTLNLYYHHRETNRIDKNQILGVDSAQKFIFWS